MSIWSVWVCVWVEGGHLHTTSRTQGTLWDPSPPLPHPLFPPCPSSPLWPLRGVFPVTCTVVVQSLSHVQLSWPHGLWPARPLCPRDCPGKNIEMGCHIFLLGIFLTQESNPGLLHCRWILYHLSLRKSKHSYDACINAQWSQFT